MSAAGRAPDGAGVSVVVVLHDSAAELPALLASLRRFLPGAQVIAVDTDSADDGLELAADAGCELVALGHNPGFGAANNAGVARARQPVTILLNPDCELLDGGLGRLAATLAGPGDARRAAEAADAGPAAEAADAGHAGRDSAAWWPRAGAPPVDALLVPRLIGPGGRVQDSAHPLPGTPGALLLALLPPSLLPRAIRARTHPWRADAARTVGWAIAACVVAPTATLRALGPFDPNAFLFYEDLDLCLRARARGVPTVLVPQVRVRHTGGHSTRRAYRAEPHDLLAARRRTVVRAARGAAAARLDDVAQAATFATRLAARALLRRPRDRERAQLRAQLRRAP